MDERIAKLTPLHFHMNSFFPKRFSLYFEFNEKKWRAKRLSQIDNNNKIKIKINNIKSKSES